MCVFYPLTETDRTRVNDEKGFKHKTTSVILLIKRFLFNLNANLF